MVDAAGITVSLKHPVKAVALYVVIGAILGLVFLAFRRYRRNEFEVFGTVALITSFLGIARIVLSLPGCSFPNIVSTAPYACSYAAFGQYVWETARGVSSGLSFVDQYASHLSDARFGGSSLMAILSVIVRPGDPASSMSLFFTICLAAIALSVYCVSQSLGYSRSVSLLAGAIAIGTGWIGDILTLGNIDQLLFIPLLDTWAALMIDSARSESLSNGRVVALALCISAAIYTYPEGFVIGALTVFPIILYFLYRFYATRQIPRLLTGLVLLVIVVSPYMPIMLHFIAGQIGSSTLQLRPGAGAFPGLLNRVRLLPSVFALGEEYGAANFSAWNLLVPVVLIALLGYGIYKVSHFRKLIVLGFSFFVLFCGYQLYALYDYGFYKVLSINYYLVATFVAGGVGALASRRVFTWLAGLVLIGAIWVELYEDGLHRIKLGCVDQLVDFKTIRFVARERPITVNISDPFTQLWAVYFLKDVPIRLVNRASYLGMPHVLPLLARAKSGAGDPVGELRPGSDVNALWSNSHFSIGRNRTVQGPVEITAITNAYGVETLDGTNFVWVGPEPLILNVVSEAAGTYRLRASRFLMGPSLPGNSKRRLQIEIGGNKKEIVIDADTKEIPLSLGKGPVDVKIVCLDTPTLLGQPNGDPRPLMVGIQDFSITR
jgi:hypothetical protein